MTMLSTGGKLSRVTCTLRNVRSELLSECEYDNTVNMIGSIDAPDFLPNGLMKSGPYITDRGHHREAGLITRNPQAIPSLY